MPFSIVHIPGEEDSLHHTYPVLLREAVCGPAGKFLPSVPKNLVDRNLLHLENNCASLRLEPVSPADYRDFEEDLRNGVAKSSLASDPSSILKLPREKKEKKKVEKKVSMLFMLSHVDIFHLTL
jgi:hypothetical protein